MTITSCSYGYARASHVDNMDSIPAQLARIEEYYNSTLKDVSRWGKVYHDESAVSASKVPFMKRAVGKKLIEIMRPGDHIIFDKVDRIWRSVEDFVQLMTYFKNQKITVHFKDFRGCSINLGTPMGDFMLTLMVAIAELESKTTGHRIREALKYRNDTGDIPRNHVPFGVKKIRVNGKKKLVFDEAQRAVMAKVVVLRDLGMTYEQISQTMHLYEDSSNPRHSIRRLYMREKAWRRLGVKSPMDVPEGYNSVRIEKLFGFEDSESNEEREERLRKYLLVHPPTIQPDSAL